MPFVPFFEGWRPAVHGTSTLTEWPVACFFHGVVSFCEGWRPAKDGTPTFTAWSLPFLSLLVFCHPMRVGVPLFTGRQPSHNGHGHFSVWF